MSVKHEDDAVFDAIGATISRRFMDVSGKVETTCNPRPRIDQYQGDSRTALGDARVTHHCADCEATGQKLEQLRTAVIAYIAAREREENSSEQMLLDNLTIWEATDDAFAALKAAAEITEKEKV